MKYASILTQSIPRRNEVDIWLKKNPECTRFLDEWLTLRRSGESSWGLVNLHSYLRSHFEFPFSSRSSILNWLRAYRAKEYAGAQQPGNSE
jgi:hypothetical protein